MKQYWVRRWELKVTLKLFGSSPGRFHPWVNNNLCNFPKRQTNSHFKDKGGGGLPSAKHTFQYGCRASVFAMF